MLVSFIPSTFTSIRYPWEKTGIDKINKDINRLNNLMILFIRVCCFNINDKFNETLQVKKRGVKFYRNEPNPDKTGVSYPDNVRTGYVTVEN